MSRINKYTIGEDENPTITEIDLPAGSKVIHVGQQMNALRVWVAIGEHSKLQRLRFHIIATGKDYDASLHFLGTVQMVNGEVWHIFEEPA